MATDSEILCLLEDLPSKWRTELLEFLHEVRESRVNPSCEEVKACQSVTSLSEFTIDGTNVSISFIDENGIVHISTFDLSQIINFSLDGIVANCLTDDTTWSNLTFQERMQLLIDSHCEDCSTTTTTTSP